MYIRRLSIFIVVAGVFAALTHCEPPRGAETLHTTPQPFVTFTAPDSTLRSSGQPFRPWRFIDHVRDYAR